MIGYDYGVDCYEEIMISFFLRYGISKVSLLYLYNRANGLLFTYIQLSATFYDTLLDHNITNH